MDEVAWDEQSYQTQDQAHEEVLQGLVHEVHLEEEVLSLTLEKLLVSDLVLEDHEDDPDHGEDDPVDAGDDLALDCDETVVEEHQRHLCFQRQAGAGVWRC